MNLIPLITFLPILAALGYYDMRYNRIPNKITYPAAALAIALNAAFSDIPFTYFLYGGGMCFVLGLVLSKITAMGGGDIKYLTLIGFMFGYPWFIAPIAGALMIGGLVMLVRFFARKPVDGAYVPFGLPLSISGATVIGWLIMIVTAG